MSNYFSHAFRNKQWVVTYKEKRGGITFYYEYKSSGGFPIGSVSWQNAKLLTRYGALKIARLARRFGLFNVRIKYQSLPVVRDKYRS